MIADDLRVFLLADSAIEAVIDDRVYPSFIPQVNPLAPEPRVPCIVYQRIDTRRDYHLRGQGVLAWPRFQLSCWAETQDAAAALAEFVRLRVSGYRGAMGSTTAKGIRVLNQGEDSEPETERHRALLDIEVLHAEPQPA